MPLLDITNHDNHSKHLTSNKLNTSPKRQYPNDLRKPAMRVSPVKNKSFHLHLYQATPKKNISSDETTKMIHSTDRYQFIPNKKDSVNITDSVFSKSPVKNNIMTHNTQLSIGGDGSLGRIRSRFSGKSLLKSPEYKGIENNLVRRNLITNLQEVENRNKEVTKTNTKINATRSLDKELKVTKVRNKNVKFELPEDRIIAMELKEIKTLLHILVDRQTQLEIKVDRLITDSLDNSNK